MKKKILSLVLTGVMAASLAACGGAATSSTASTASKAASTAASTAASVAASTAASTATSVAASTATSTAASTAASTTTSTSSGDSEIKSTGPNGEAGVNANTITLTDDEIAKVKAGNYTAAICMHYGGNDWSTSQIAGLTDEFNKLGIKIVATTDANFSAEQQVSDIETVMAKNPNIIVSIPTDATATADAYQKAADAGIKLVFMDNVPKGFTAGKNYVSCVSADNYGNGMAAAKLLAESLGGKGKIGTIYYDVDFFVTNQRYKGFKDELAAEYPDVKIVDEEGFTDVNSCNVQADAMLTAHPDVQGIWAHWDVACEGLLSSIKAANRTDIKVTTCDLGNNIAKEIALGNVVGLGAQMPYDQGVAEAKLAAYAMLGKETPAYVVAPAMSVDKSNIADAYKAVYHIDPPDWLNAALKGQDVSIAS